ncbi:MAG: hypothetical protein ABIE07_03640 [Candidatus Zixiibacteriota bacterium]
MAQDEVFKVATKLYGLYGVFFKVVAQEVGMEKALALHAKAHEDQGVASGKMLKETIGNEKIDIQRLGSILREGSNLSIGIDSNLDQSDSTLALFDKVI